MNLKTTKSSLHQARILLVKPVLNTGISDKPARPRRQALSPVTVKANLPPIITLPNGSTPLVYNTLGKQPQAIDPNATVTDEDSPDLDSGRLEVVIAKNRTANDILEIQNLGPITVSSNTGGIISFNSTPIGHFFINLITGALVANLNTAATPESTTALLQAISYKNTSPTSSTEARIMKRARINISFKLIYKFIFRLISVFIHPSTRIRPKLKHRTIIQSDFDITLCRCRNRIMQIN
ncbi:hypothetical protein BGS_0995 [Beggiatoa sp. SS]|nr:hypothetical protein BGS_0995 [Beggiatoa sp. SS]